MGRGSKGAPPCCGCTRLVNRLICCTRQDEALPPPPPLTGDGGKPGRKSRQRRPRQRSSASPKELADQARADASFAQQYKLCEEVGRGAFGTVRVATRRLGADRTPLAVKTFDLKQLTAVERRDAIDEAAMLKSLSHESIVSFVEVFVGMQKIHLVTSYVGGGTVFDQLSHGGDATASRPIRPYSEGEARATLRRVLSVLCYLHNREGKNGLYVLYRDLKPENVLIERAPDGHVDRTNIRLCDFGFAIRLRTAVPGVGGKMTRELATEPCYTPGYGAPEVIAGRPYGEAADIFSCGVLAYVLLTGGLPYDEDIWDDTAALDSATAAGQLVFDHAPEWPTLSPEAHEFVRAALAYSAHERPLAHRLMQHAWLQEHGCSTASERPPREPSDPIDCASVAIACEPAKERANPEVRKQRTEQKQKRKAAKQKTPQKTTQKTSQSAGTRLKTHLLRRASNANESAPLLEPSRCGTSN